MKAKKPGAFDVAFLAGLKSSILHRIGHADQAVKMNHWNDAVDQFSLLLSHAQEMLVAIEAMKKSDPQICDRMDAIGEFGRKK